MQRRFAHILHRGKRSVNCQSGIGRFCMWQVVALLCFVAVDLRRKVIWQWLFSGTLGSHLSIRGFLTPLADSFWLNRLKLSVLLFLCFLLDFGNWLWWRCADHQTVILLKLWEKLHSLVFREFSSGIWPKLKFTQGLCYSLDFGWCAQIVEVELEMAQIWELFDSFERFQTVVV